MWSVAFKLQKKDEKTEDSSSASSEFSKIRKASNGYSFLGSLDRSFEQQWKKKKPHTNHSCYLQCQSAKKRQRSGAGWQRTHILSQLDRAQNTEKWNYFSWGIMHDYSRIIIFLWTTTLKKPKMSLRCAQNFSQCCFSPPVQTDLLRWDYLSEDLGKMWYHHFLHKEQAVFCGQTLHFGDSVKRLWVFLTQNIWIPHQNFSEKHSSKLFSWNYKYQS